MLQLPIQLILLILSTTFTILILVVSAIDFYFSHVSKPKSDIVLDGETSSPSNAETHPGEYSFSLYFLATNRGDLDGHITGAKVNRIRFFNTDGPDEKILTENDLIGPYGNAPIVVLNEEKEIDGEIEYEKGAVLIPSNSTKEILIVPRIMGGKNPAYDDNEYNAVEVNLTVTIRDTEREYTIEAESGTIYAYGVFDSSGTE